jgi:hypothetical protein
MTKKEVCALLSISPKTLQRRIAQGTYTATRTGEGQYAELSFSFADIGMPEPAPAVPEPTPVVETAPAVPVPTPERLRQTGDPEVIILGPIEEQRQSDLAFAEAYKRGEATDSAGNQINGTNERWPTKGVQSLLGPMEPKAKKKFSCDEHMGPEQHMHDQPVIGWNGEEIFDAASDAHPLNRERVLREQSTKSVATKLQHPNQTRQDMLSTIFSDIRRGYSR